MLRVFNNNNELILNSKDVFNRLSANPTKWSNTLKQFVRKLPTNCFSVFDHFVGLTLKGLRPWNISMIELLHENN